MPLARATAIRAFEPFEREEEAAAWLAAATAEEAGVDAVVDAGIALVNDALHAQAIAAADPQSHAVTPERAVAVRIGWGSGEETAAGAFSEAREVDVAAAGLAPAPPEPRTLRPQERVAALLRGRERAAACEPLLLRARADLDAGRDREAALQLRVGIEALLAELAGALDDDGHREDVDVPRRPPRGGRGRRRAGPRRRSAPRVRGRGPRVPRNRRASPPQAPRAR